MAKRKLPRSHKVVLSVTFDKPISRANAIKEIRDNIHGEFYTSDIGNDDTEPYPGEFRVRGISNLPKAR